MSDAGLGGQPPAGDLAGQCVRARQLRLQPVGGAELGQRLLVATAAGQQHPVRVVQQQPDVGPAVRLPCLPGTLQPPLAVVELTGPDQGGGHRDQRGRDHPVVGDRKSVV